MRHGGMDFWKKLYNFQREEILQKNIVWWAQKSLKELKDK